MFPNVWTWDALWSRIELFISSPLVSQPLLWFIGISIGAFALTKLFEVMTGFVRGSYESSNQMSDYDMD